MMNHSLLLVIDIVIKIMLVKLIRHTFNTIVLSTKSYLSCIFDADWSLYATIRYGDCRRKLIESSIMLGIRQL